MDKKAVRVDKKAVKDTATAAPAAVAGDRGGAVTVQYRHDSARQ